MSESNGTRLVDRLVALTPTERRKVSIPELGLDLYVKPPTKAEMEKAYPKDKVKRPPLMQALFLLVQLAENEAGEKVFKRTDIDKLYTKVDASILGRIEEAMYAAIAPEIPDAEAVIESDPTSASA